MIGKPLEGIRVADFSHVMAGPYASHLLRLLGAEVIKIEAPDRGDAMRYYGNDRRYDGMAPAFIAVNAGKKSIALDLKRPAAREAARRLVASCDVLLENFRPGVMARLGLDYETVRKLQPRIVYCSVSGYGQQGPRRDWPAIDNIVQATSGMMTLGGVAGDAPTRVGFPVVDTLTGQTAAFAILAALFRRDRRRHDRSESHGEGAGVGSGAGTGAGAGAGSGAGSASGAGSGSGPSEDPRAGEFIDVAMFDASIAFMTSAAVPYLVTGRAPERTGNTGYSGQPTSALFEARDGRRISLGVVQQAQFEMLARQLECERWLSDPRYKTADLRRQHTDALQTELREVFKTADAQVWEERLSGAGIPCGMVRDVAEAVSLPGLDARSLRLPLHIPALPEREDVHIVNAGFLFGNDRPDVSEPPPRLGEHSETILEQLGFSPAERQAILE